SRSGHCRPWAPPLVCPPPLSVLAPCISVGGVICPTQSPVQCPPASGGIGCGPIGPWPVGPGPVEAGAEATAAAAIQPPSVFVQCPSQFLPCPTGDFVPCPSVPAFHCPSRFLHSPSFA